MYLFYQFQASQVPRSVARIRTIVDAHSALCVNFVYRALATVNVRLQGCFPYPSRAAESRWLLMSTCPNLDVVILAAMFLRCVVIWLGTTRDVGRRAESSEHNVNKALPSM